MPNAKYLAFGTPDASAPREVMNFSFESSSLLIYFYFKREPWQKLLSNNITCSNLIHLLVKQA